MKILEGFFEEKDRVNLTTELVENVTKEIRKHTQEEYEYFVFNILDYVGEFDGQLCCTRNEYVELDLLDKNKKIGIHHQGLLLNNDKVRLNYALFNIFYLMKQVVLKQVPDSYTCLSISLDTLIEGESVDDIHSFYLDLVDFLGISRRHLNVYFDDETNTVSYFNV